ncbi:MAG: hypothetical protein GY803_26310 [Chloroflexi bacterium]|nr:hypothetical protein [Chloroflexota bacterium]
MALPEDKTQVKVVIPKELKEIIREQAFKNKRSFSREAGKALEKYYAEITDYQPKLK